MLSVHVSLHLGVEHIEVINGEQVVWIGVRVRGKLFTFFETLASLRVCRRILPRHLFPNSVQKLTKESI